MRNRRGVNNAKSPWSIVSGVEYFYAQKRERNKDNIKSSDKALHQYHASYRLVDLHLPSPHLEKIRSKTIIAASCLITQYKVRNAQIAPSDEYGTTVLNKSPDYLYKDSPCA